MMNQTPGAAASSEQTPLRSCRADLPAKLDAGIAAMTEISRAREALLNGGCDLLIGAIGSLIASGTHGEIDIHVTLSDLCGTDLTVEVTDALYDNLGHYWFQLPDRSFHLIH